jgi:hypothetical protein
MAGDALAHSMRRPLARAMAVLCLLFLSLTPAHAASADLFSASTLSINADVRIVAADGDRSWTDGGYGKARFGGDKDRDWKIRPVAAEGELIWQPRFSWSVSGTVVVAAQHGQDHPVDLIESFASFKPVPKGSTQISGKAGLFWPSISLEHTGAGWQVADMITPSAINSWIGEEVKVVGAEATVSRDIGGSKLSGTLGIFGFNDTAGTMLAFRGWGLHDFKATAFGKQPLPPLNELLEYAQAAKTRPLIEVDDRPGFYAKLQWRMAAPVTLSLFHYDNRGVPEAVTKDLQWGWKTRFWNAGARIDLGSRTRILAQALAGRTEMGFREPDRYWVDTRFRSAFLRVTHQIDRLTISGRADWFRTRERGAFLDRRESENGWAGTAAVSFHPAKSINIIGELLHVDNKRGGVRVDELGLPRNQRQTVLQAVLRLNL